MTHAYLASWNFDLHFGSDVLVGNGKAHWSRCYGLRVDFCDQDWIDVTSHPVWLILDTLGQTRDGCYNDFTDTLTFFFALFY